MNKFERIQLVRHLGLNTEVSVLIETIDDIARQTAFLSRLAAYSVRTFSRTAERHTAPHLPIIGPTEFQNECLPLLSRGYSLIVAEPIDPADAQLAGCILRQSSSYLIEVADGPGTVRRVTHDGRIDRVLDVSGPQDARCPRDIRAALHELNRAESRWRGRVPLIDVLYEFSVYRNPVGWKQEQTIFWDIEGLGDVDRLLERFLYEVQGR